MTQPSPLLPPGRYERLLSNTALVASVYVLTILLAAVGYALDLEVLIGFTSWLGGCAFVLGAQALVAHRHNTRQRYSPRNLDRLQDYEPPSVP